MKGKEQEYTATLEETESLEQVEKEYRDSLTAYAQTVNAKGVMSITLDEQTMTQLGPYFENLEELFKLAEKRFNAQARFIHQLRELNKTKDEMIETQREQYEKSEKTMKEQARIIEQQNQLLNVYKKQLEK